MKKLTISRRIIFALFAVLFGVNLWGQSLTLQNPSLPNSETNPYLIGSANDWNLLVSDVNNDTDPYTYDGEYINLTADIVVDNMVGTPAYGFSGIFDGKYNNVVHTITFNYSNYAAAPFYDTYNATIQNLKVEGNIDASYGGDAAGLIYINYESTTVSNVTVSVNITAPDQAQCAGFAVYNHKYDNPGVLTFTNCVYNGQIVAGSNSGGFWTSQGDNGTATFENCIFDPAEGSSIAGGKTFGTVADASTDITECYYTSLAGTTAQGTLAYKAAPAEDFVKKVTYNGYTVYGHVGVTLPNVAATYEYNNGNAISVNCAVTFDDDAIQDTDYTVSITKNGSPVATVADCGEYVVVVAGTGSKGSYYGAYSQSFYVVKPLSGNGEEGTPYIIASAEDWISFAYYVNSGNSYSGKYVHLTNDITVSTMVGTSEHPFSGIFTGQAGEHAANTLTFNYGTSENPTTEEIVAPFRYTDGATIISLIVDGAIYTNVGKEAGLIGVNTRTSGNNTTVRFVINNVNFICYEDLLDAEGGGYAYDGSGISFIYSSYEGTISANNYHGGFCGNANAETTSFSNCLFNPTESGFYWAQNFVFNMTGTQSANYFNTSYYTVGHNQEESDQGTMVFVNTVPEGNIGHKLTTFHEKVVYKPVTVVISGVNKRYPYTDTDITITPAVTFDGTDALTNNYCEWSITPSYPMHDVGQYTFTLTAPKTGATGEALNYLGTISQIVRVVNPSSSDWAALQDALSGPKAAMDLDTIASGNNFTAGTDDVCLVIESGRTVTINLKGRTINRGFYDEEKGVWGDPVIGGQVLKILSGATVIINGPGTIMGGCNKAPSNTEHAENSDAGGIFNMGSLTLNNVNIEGNYCEKFTDGVHRTARGGGIYSGKSSTLIINNCTISHNEAKGGGGGLYAEKAAVFEMYDTNVQSNVSQDKGGGVRVNADGTKHDNGAKTLVAGALIKDCIIYNNTVQLHTPQSASNGGGIHMDAGILDLTNSTVNQNYSSKFGGGIYQMGGTINASDCEISFNQSYDDYNLFEGCGGGVCLLGGTFRMVGGKINGNSSYISDGGGIYVASGKTLKLEGSVNIYENWTFEDEYVSDKHTTNVYLAGSNDKITISANIAGASVGVSKNGGVGRFTSGLNGKGTTANFVSDYADYQVLPDGNEAKLGVPAEMPSEVDDLHLPEGMEKDGDEYVIKVPFTVDQPVVILRSVRFENDGCIIITENGILRVPSITNSDPLKIIIEDGGQIIFTGTPGDVAARVKKEVKEFSSTKPIDNWYLISSPVSNPAITTATNIVVDNPVMVMPKPGYDLYRFNESTENVDENGLILYWENYRSTSPVHEGFSVDNDASALENGRGYLYRSCQDYTLTFDGNINIASFDYSLSYTEKLLGEDNVFKGFNIIGNPYSHNIVKGEAGTGVAIPNTYLENKYYVLNPTGCTWDLTNDGTAIKPLQGIVVQAKSGSTLAISNEVPAAAKGGIEENDNIWFTVANNTYEDKACVEFRKGRGLNKISHPNEDAPMLYIRHNGESFASVDMNPEVKAFNLNFEAKTFGRYTLSYKMNGDFSYLHLYDKVTGEDIDMLSDDEYTFVGSASDAANRFVVRLSEVATNVDNNATFAYQSGDDIVVCGDGELQVFDVMGRLVAKQYVNGVGTWHAASVQTGVYILRLNEKTQKIVIR